jgi:hypothetical protein
LQKPSFVFENQGGVEIVAGSDPNLVSGNYHDQYGPVVMEMASGKPKSAMFLASFFHADQVLQ